MTARLLFALALAAVARPADAQTDYRNLDEGRPVHTEDAYPVERYAFELVLPYRYHDPRAGDAGHLVVPELAYGILPDMELGAKLAFAGGPDWGFAGPRLFALYNFNTESPGLPALALRTDLALPIGGLAGDAVRAGLTGIATRSWGRTRAHVNAAVGFGADDVTSAVDPLPDWSAGVAVDHTFLRRSLLVIAELGPHGSGADEPVAVNLGLGARLQLTPTVVLDAGVERRLTDGAGADLGLTVGLSHAFAAGGLMPRGPGAGVAPWRRAEQFYYPGRFNWRFLRSYPEAGRLFNAFDYGHAVLYETLLSDRAAAPAALAEEYRYLTRDLLVRPPPFAIAEEAVMPDYARIAWRATQMFDWAHVLHRQIYDVYADERLAPGARDSLIERLTDYYLSRTDVAFTAVPKSMDLMERQPFSRVFRRNYPRFNGLIWSYHWLQVGLYEPLITGATPAEKKQGVQATVARFRQMVRSERYPAVMPMTSGVAPAFSTAHPRAAVIFDNLHMMHDIISDILASPTIPRHGKKAEIERQLAEFRNPATNVITLDEWRAMPAHMGGVDAMGGRALELPAHPGAPSGQGHHD